MPKISLKTPEEIAIMTQGGKKLGKIMTEVLGGIGPGISTLEIDSRIEKMIAREGGEAAFKKVPGYHWASCIGLNDEVVHSIPRKDRQIKEGDLVKIDIGILWQGFNTDMSWTVSVGRITRNSEQSGFLEAGERALKEAIAICRPGNRIGDISRTIEEVITKAGYHPVAVLTGHGIGRHLHEEPLIPGVLRGASVETPMLQPGMTLAIEVIYGKTTGEVVLSKDGWTILTKDGKISGLFEKTIAITEGEPLELTRLGFERLQG